jgi:peptidylprolyl isomerase
MIAAGDRVTVHYTSRTLEGCVLETTRSREPVEFTVGSDDVIRGLSQGIVGLRPGEVRSLSIPPELGFGNPHPELVQHVPRALLPESVASGDQLALVIGHAEYDVWIRRLMASEAQVDANHPLAGETLLVDLEIIEVATPA